jgi:hypothetical protein
MDIEKFNDSRTSYSKIAAVIARAKELATANLRQQVPSPSPQIQQSHPALTYRPEERVVTLTLVDLERVAVKRR